MSILFTDEGSPDALDWWSTTYKLEPQPWWRRLLRLKRPAGSAYVHFRFRFEGGDWKTAEALAQYPKGMDAIKLTVEFRQDGQALDFAPDICIGDIP